VGRTSIVFTVRTFSTSLLPDAVRDC